jgi:hypothetical protein
MAWGIVVDVPAPIEVYDAPPEPPRTEEFEVRGLVIPRGDVVV